MMEAIKDYLRSCCGVLRMPLAYVVRKTVLVEIHADYPKYVTFDNERVTRMLHLPLDKNKLHNKKSVESVKAHMAEYEIDNRSVYNILDQIC